MYKYVFEGSKYTKKIFFCGLVLLLNVNCFTLLPCYSQQLQQRKMVNVYNVNPKKLKHSKVYLPIGSEKVHLKEGWTITEKKAGIVIQRILEKDTVIVSTRDSAVSLVSNWKIEAIKFSADKPDKMFLNPVPFITESDSLLNQLVYIPIPVNEEIRLTHLHTKWSAITIPFSIRPAINNRLKSQVTNEFKVGTAFSLNHDWEFYKNRRIDIKSRTYGLSLGLGFGLGRVKLDEGSTRLSGANYSNEEEGLIFFITPGLGLNIRGFKVLGFYGWDIGLTQNTTDWNYNKRPYIGIGLGFDFWTLKR